MPVALTHSSDGSPPVPLWKHRSRIHGIGSNSDNRVFATWQLSDRFGGQSLAERVPPRGFFAVDRPRSRAFQRIAAVRLEAKNRLTASDARLVELAFELRLSDLAGKQLA